MRITVFLLFACILQTFANDAYSQKTRLSLDFSKTKLVDVFDEIEERSEFFFLYNEKLVDTERKVTLSIENKKVDEILDQLFDGTDVVYTITNRKIILAPSFLSEKEQQQNSISGKVTDENGESLPGVTVVVKGTTQGTVTDIDGNYNISNVKAEDVLVFSFIGMVTQELEVGEQTSISIKMLADAIGIEEVVAIGYGSQKRVNLTGSVSTVDTKSITAKATGQNVGAALIGEAAGVTVRQKTSRPGADDVEIRIRGIGTFSGAGSSPLVLVDGIPQDMNTVDMNDIQSISVLKDASSAAIYGNRAANGVILIETKRGTSTKPTVEINSYVGFQRITERPDFINSWEYAQAYNEALVNSGGAPRYADEDIAKFKSGDFPDTHPNEDPYGYFFGSGNPIQAHTNIAIGGGNERTKFRFSMGYDRNNAIVKNNYAQAMNFRLNLDSKIYDNLHLLLNVSSRRKFHTEPLVLRNGRFSYREMIKNSFWYPVTMPLQRSDGTYPTYQGYNPKADLDSGTFNDNWNNNILFNPKLVWEVIPSLKLIGELAYKVNNSKAKAFIPLFEFEPGIGTNYAEVQDTRSDNDLLTLRAIADYSKVIGEKHDVQILAGYEQEEYKTSYLTGYRNIFPNNSLYELNAGSTENQTNKGSGSEWASQSFFGRLSYAYDGKYLAEFNLRADGSSRFPEGNRWGLFPSGSLGWRIIENLKLRGSYGILGNSQISTYPYQRTIALGQNYAFDDVVSPGAATTSLPNETITWEKTRVIDLGVDFTVLNGKLSGSVDYFDRLTSDILYKISVSSVLGLTPAEQNAGEVSNKGWELDLSYNDNVGDFNYSVSANFSMLNNKVESLAQVEYDIGKGLFIGEPVQSHYGYIWDGWFSEEDVATNYPSEEIATQPWKVFPGYPRFKDISGPDGIPDGKVDATYDRKVIGSPFPKYTGAANIFLEYKNLSVTMQWQGAAGVTRYLQGMSGSAFHNWGPVQRWQYEDHWSTENQDRWAAHPRFQRSLNKFPVGVPSTMPHVMRDASFLKLKNLEIGYNLPGVAKKLKMQQLRIFASATNLLSFDKFPEGWDPEEETGDWYWGVHYPLLSTTVVGINVKF